MIAFHDEQEKLLATNGHRLKSSFLVAFVSFWVLNAGLAFCSPIKFDQFRFPYKGWAWWTFNDLRNDRQIHNVALLGSSLMCSAIAGVDANFLNRPLDLARYHKASYLDYKLSTRFGGSFNAFNLAAPGQMPSDAYLALRAMVNCANRPDIVIYGIAPRDFIDSTLSSPADTEPFKYLRRLVNIDDVAQAIWRSPFGKLDWWLQSGVYLYGYSLDFQMSFVCQMERFLAVLVPKPWNNPPFTWWDRVRLLPGYLAGEIRPEAVICNPVTEKEARSTYKDNTAEYWQRYKSPDPHTYKTQVSFMKCLMDFCHKERIELIVVNMPITLYNAGMLAPGIYMKYVQAMRQIAFERGATFYDLADFREFTQSNFYDSVHMNAFGGQKFIDNLIGWLACDRKTASALAMAGKELERHLALASRSNKGTY